jgi:hypothetical protein
VMIQRANRGTSASMASSAGLSCVSVHQLASRFPS